MWDGLEISVASAILGDDFESGFEERMEDRSPKGSSPYKGSHFFSSISFNREPSIVGSAHAPEVLEGRRSPLGKRHDVIEFDLEPGATSHSFGEGFSFGERCPFRDGFS